MGKMRVGWKVATTAAALVAEKGIWKVGLWVVVLVALLAAQLVVSKAGQ